jgi:hypothetical protein
MYLRTPSFGDKRMNRVQPFNARPERGRSYRVPRSVHSSQKDARGVHREADCRRVLDVLLAAEARNGRSWYSGGVALCLAMLVYQSEIGQDRCRSAIRALKDARILSGGDVHWFIRLPTQRRRPIPEAVRIDVLSVGICEHCGATSDLEVDHVVPISLGGSDDRDNLQCLCLMCNRRKGNRFEG